MNLDILLIEGCRAGHSLVWRRDEDATSLVCKACGRDTGARRANLTIQQSSFSDNKESWREGLKDIQASDYDEYDY